LNSATPSSESADYGGPEHPFEEDRSADIPGITRRVSDPKHPHGTVYQPKAKPRRESGW